LPSATEVLIRKFGTCPVKGFGQAATVEHHILYDYHEGGPVTKRLCPEHHDWLTRRQAHAARKHRRPLSERQRWFFWYELIEGRMTRPRRTHLDREWSQ